MAPLLLVLLFTAASFAEGQPSEYDLKSAFLFQFASYVEWPAAKFADASQPLIFGVIGAEEVAANLRQLADVPIAGGRHIEVRNVQPGDDIANLHALFVAQASGSGTEEMLMQAVQASVLTVTEADQRPRNSVINFELVDGKVRFDVSLPAARNTGLQVSSRLLQVAVRVLEQP